MKKYMVYPAKIQNKPRRSLIVLLISIVFFSGFFPWFVYCDYKYNDTDNHIASWIFGIFLILLILALFKLMRDMKAEQLKYVIFDNVNIQYCDGKDKQIFSYDVNDVTAVQRVVVVGKEIYGRGAFTNNYNDYICIVFYDNVIFPRRVEHLIFKKLGRPNREYTSYELNYLQRRTYVKSNDVELPELKKPLSSYEDKEISVHIDKFVYFAYTDEAWKDMKDMFGDKVIE